MHQAASDRRLVSSIAARVWGGLGDGSPSPPALVWVPAAFVALGLILPLTYLVLRTLGAEGDVWALLLRPRSAQTLARTLALIIAVTGLSVALALPLAWLTTRTDIPFRRVWSVLLAVPLVIPSYVAGYVVVAAFGPRGILQGLLEKPFGVDRLPEIYGFPGAVLAILVVSYPYAFLTLQASFRGLDPALEEASRSLGHGPWFTFRRVTLPHLRPSIAAGALLVALYTLSDFGAVSLLRYETFTWAIYLQYEGSFDRMLAAALSLTLALVAVILLLVEFRAQGKALLYRNASGAGRLAAPVALHRWRWPALAFCGFVAALCLAMPIAVLGYWVAKAFIVGESVHAAWGPVFNSVLASTLAAVASTVAALPIVILAVRYPGRLSALLERTTYLGFALPGLVVALSLVFFGANFARPLYQTLALLIFAYVVLFLSQVVGAGRASLLRVSPHLEEAARSLGRTPMRTIATVTLPLMRPGVLAGASLVFLSTMKELPATLLLSPIGFKTLATTIWSATEMGFLARAAVPALLLILASSVPMALFVTYQQRETQ